MNGLMKGRPPLISCFKTLTTEISSWAKKVLHKYMYEYNPSIIERSTDVVKKFKLL